MMYRPGDLIRATRPIGGKNIGEVFDPVSVGWGRSNIQAFINQGAAEVVSTVEAPDDEDVQLFRVSGPAGKYYVVRGTKISDLVLKDEADRIIAEASNGDESSAG